VSLPDLNVPILRAGSLILEPQVVRHAEELFRLFQDPELSRYITRDPPRDFSVFLEGIAFLEGRKSRDQKEYWLNWVAFEASTQEIVGQFELSLDPAKGEANLAYFVFRAYQRRGFAKQGCRAVLSYAFQKLGLRVAKIEMDQRNQASWALAESLGARRIRAKSRAQEIRGQWSDEFLYELRLEDLRLTD
jgi:ribosomal-protein-alanine N-acetyltransferase